MTSPACFQFSPTRSGPALRGWRLALSSVLMSLCLVPLAQAAESFVAEVTGISAAENSIQTKSGRMFVSSNGNLYELATNGTVWTKSVLPAEFADNKSRPCYYLGMTEYSNALYSVCTEDSASATAPKYLMAHDLGVAGAPLREIAKLQSVGLPNGLTSDGAGNLYFANLATLVPGNIWRIKLTSRFVVANQQAIYQFATLNPNGMKFNAGKLYVTANPPLLVGVSQLLRFPVSSSGLGTPTTIYSATTFLDDFGLVKNGVLLANYLGGALLHISETGVLLHSQVFALPTSAALIKTPSLPSNAVLVTLGGANKAVVLQTNWGLSPR